MVLRLALAKQTLTVHADIESSVLQLKDATALVEQNSAEIGGEVEQRRHSGMPDRVKIINPS